MWNDLVAPLKEKKDDLLNITDVLGISNIDLVMDGDQSPEYFSIVLFLSFLFLSVIYYIIMFDSAFNLGKAFINLN